MPDISLQGPLDQPEDRSRLIDYLEAGLRNPEFDDLKIMVAYAKAGPLKKLRSAVELWKSQGKQIDAIFGIDQQGTSLEALQLASNLFDSVSVFHQPGLVNTFHPKLYMFRGQVKSSVYIGSNNLTTGGTETNFECGVQLNFALSESSNLVHQLEEIWQDTLRNALPLSEELLADLQGAGMIISEVDSRRELRNKYKDGSDNEERAAVPDFPKVDVQSARSMPRREAKGTDSHLDSGSSRGQTEVERITESTLLKWRKRNLKSRDAQRPGKSTNPSGVVTLVQDYFKDDQGNRIDKTTYFRYDVFGELDWWEEDGKEVTKAQFRVWVGSGYRGTYTLRISHKIEWESGQDNYTTAIHWDDLNPVLRNEIDIRGWNFYLYKVESSSIWEIQLVPPEDLES